MARQRRDPGFTHAPVAPADTPDHVVVELRHDSGVAYSASGFEAAPAHERQASALNSTLEGFMAKAAPKSLSRHERNLARYLQLILPRRADPAACIETLRRWDCLAEVRRAPELALPRRPC